MTRLAGQGPQLVYAKGLCKDSMGSCSRRVKLEFVEGFGYFSLLFDVTAGGNFWARISEKCASSIVCVFLTLDLRRSTERWLGL